MIIRLIQVNRAISLLVKQLNLINSYCGFNQSHLISVSRLIALLEHGHYFMHKSIKIDY